MLVLLGFFKRVFGAFKSFSAAELGRLEDALVNSILEFERRRTSHGDR